MKYSSILVIVAVVAFGILAESGWAVEGDSYSLSKTSAVPGPNLPGPGRSGRDTIEVIIGGTQVTGNRIPFWGSTYTACRFQALYPQSEINVAGKIVTFSYMPYYSDVGTYNNTRFYLCHTNVSQLSTVFDDNYGGNTPVEVINEPSMQVGGPANTWVDLDVDFNYNNTDNLLWEVRWNGSSGQDIFIWRTNASVPRRVYAWDDNATTGTTGTQCYYIKLSIVTVGVEEQPSGDLLQTSMTQNLPNPFNTVTSIRYSVARSSHTTLKIFDASGRAIRTLVDKVVEPGIHTAYWNGRDDKGASVVSGVYFYRLESGSTVQTRKMTYLR